MTSSLRSRIALALALVVLAFCAAGYLLYHVPVVPLSVMAIIVMLGILVVSWLQAGVLTAARHQIDEYVATPDLGPPDPPPPVELQPFFDSVIKMQETLRQQRAAMEKESQARRKLDEAVLQAVSALQSQPALAARFEAFLVPVMEETRATAAGYYAWEVTGLPPSSVVWKGTGAPMPERALMVSGPESEMSAGRIAAVPDAASDDAPASLRSFAQERGFASAVFVPAMRDARPIGFLAVFTRDRCDVDDSLQGYFERLQRPMAWAQDAAHRFEKAMESERVARSVNELLMAAGTSFGLDEAAASTLAHLHALEPFSRGGVLLVENDEFLEVFAPSREGETGYFLGSRMRREGSAVARVMETRAVEIDNDIRNGRTFQEDPLLIDEGYLSRLVIPLVTAGKPIGAVYLVNRAAAAFSREKAEDLKVPLEAVAVALEILRFNRELGDRVASLDVGMAEKGMFLTGLNHEIRSQLKTVMQLAEPLLDHRASGLRTRASEAVQEILGRSRQLLGMLDGVVDIERMDAGEKTMHIEEFFVAEAVKDVLWDLQAVLKSRSLEAVWELPQGLPPMVADAERFRSLLYQLMSRAAAVTPAGGQVVFKANLLPSTWIKEKAHEFMPAEIVQGIGPGVDVMIFSIIDQGEPVDPEIRTKIFTEGGTPGLDSETTLKLYFVRRVVDMHRGQIWMEPGPDGVGNRVGLVLPQYSLDRVGFVNYLGKRLKEARETLSCLSLVSVGYKERTRLRQALGEETFYRAMKELEGVVRQAIREPVDAVRRFHNGELIVVFAETDRNGAARMLERLLQKVGAFQSSVMTSSQEVVTSVATYPDDAMRAEEIIRCLESGVAVG